MKRRPSEWLDIVKEYYNGNISITRLAIKRNCDSAKLKYLIKLYDLYGEYPFSDEQESKIYTREQKLKAIEEYLSGTKSGRQIALELGSPNPDVVRDWRHIYETKGEAGIHVSRKAFAPYLSKYQAAAQNTSSAKLPSDSKNNSYSPAPDCLKTRHNMDGRRQTKLDGRAWTTTTCPTSVGFLFASLSTNFVYLKSTKSYIVVY